MRPTPFRVGLVHCEPFLVFPAEIPYVANMPVQHVLYSAEHRIARITLNRPEQRNALDDEMVKDLMGAVQHAARDSSAKVVVLAANGPDFCAGSADQYLQRVSTFDLESNRADSFLLGSLFRSLYELRKPVVALVNGPALAGGCGLATVCDFVIASEENARFGYTEVHMGCIPALVMGFLVKRVGEGRAKELVLRGNIIDAREAHAAGLVTVVVPAEQIESAAMSLAEELLSANSATAMAMAKEMLAKLNGMSLLEAMDFAVNMNAAARMTPDCKQGLTAFLSGQKLQW
jgi:methylglutaconyl-CoA hydratase